MPYCTACKSEISCSEHEGFGHHSLDQPVRCTSLCSIWVRAVDDKGVPVAGVTARASDKSGITDQEGFAQLEDLPEGKNTVHLGLTGPAAASYQPLDPVSRDESLARGELKLIRVTVKPRVTPVITIAEPVVALGGKAATLTLTTDLPYTGKGTFTCTQGADKLELTPALTDGKLEISSVPGGGQAITVEARDASDLDGIAFTWEIEPTVQKGPAATGTMTAMKASLDVFRKSGAKAAADLVVHLQNATGKRRRAKADLTWKPMGVEGSLTLANPDGRLAVYDADTRGNTVAKVTMEKDKSSATVYLEGAKASTAKDDAELVLGIEGRCESAAAAKLTVVDTKLVVCDRRVDDKTDPLPLADDKKEDPGRAIYLQGAQRASTRALLRVLKTPTDAPCDLVLKAEADHVRLWAVEIPKDKEEEILTPKTLNSGDFSDPVKGFVAWAEGAKVTPTGVRSAFTLEVTGVEDVSDTVAFTVGLAKIEIEIVRSDAAPLSEAVKIGVKETAKGVASSVKDYASAKIEHEVAPGSYLFELAPQKQEAAFNISRTVPDGSLEAALVVQEGSATPVKFSLEPPPQYNDFQFIGYEIETGKYMGLDASANDEGDARSDFLGRCKIMAEAIDEAFKTADSRASTMKVFVAPEFYFRGLQGAYPAWMLHEIIDELRKHTKDPKFKDWLFVYGSAIGFLKHSENTELDDVTDVIAQPSRRSPKRLRGRFNGTGIPKGTLLKQGSSTGFVHTATVDLGAKTCEILADFPDAVSGVDLKLTQLGETEIFNVVFVQKGGPGTPMNRDGSCALKDLLIYKELISSVDFTSDDYGENDFYKEHRHATILSGGWNRTLPTEGSTDVLGKRPNVMGEKRTSTKGFPTSEATSEKTTSGLGGGALFTVDGVDFGVDVCLDHAAARLRKSGSRVHIHLIPSCGMAIDDNNIAIVPRGFVFNVDGMDGYAHTRLQRDTDLIGAPTATPFAGTNRAAFFEKDGKIYVYPPRRKLW